MNSPGTLTNASATGASFSGKGGKALRHRCALLPASIRLFSGKVDKRRRDGYAFFQRDAQFEAAVGKVLEKNAELYRRLT